jgi:hypothetical protein
LTSTAGWRTIFHRLSMGAGTRILTGGARARLLFGGRCAKQSVANCGSEFRVLVPSVRRDPSIAGRQVRLEDIPFTIVGVTAREFTGTSPNRIDIWMPMASAPLLRPSHRWVLNILRKPQNCCVSARRAIC